MPTSPPTSRVIAVLEDLASANGGVTASTLARSLGLSTSTLSLILTTLREAHYVERLPDRSYRLGSGLMRLLTALQGRFPVLQVASEELAQLSETLDCGASISWLSPDGQEVILTMGATEQLGIKPGVRTPNDPPHGMVAMAWRSPEEINRWLSKAPNAIRETYRECLSQVRRLGFAVYGLHPDAWSMIDQLRDLLVAVQSDHNTNELHEQLEQLSAFVGSRIYSAPELEDESSRPVSYVIAPIFAADQQPRYLISLHLMERSISRASLLPHIDALLRSAKVLTQHTGGEVPQG